MRRRDFAPVGGNPGKLTKAVGYAEFSQSTLKCWLLFFNLVGAIAHGMGVALTLGLGRRDIRLRSYRVVPLKVGNDTLDAVLEKDVAFYPTWMITIFFSLSLTFHAVISVLLILYSAVPQNKYFALYMKCIYENIAPWRWLEYSVSASMMVLLSCVLLGLRNIHVLITITGLMTITIVFGWVTELHSAYLIEDVSESDVLKFCGWQLERRWKPGSWKTRFQIHALGYLPYGLLWTIVFDQFRVNMELVGDSIPDFVNIAVIGSFALFTLFGLVQLLLQLLPFGPSVYWIGEATYIVLSFAAKAQLGFIVLFQALVEDGMYDSALLLNRDA
tara:strand:+ start:262 stop:1251 length:990 start_codon:yes stop_codon:yes gene_type:complete